ncbi:hypothetical protein ACIA8I_41565 [Streptomyces rishiriensis]|uniref:hypothetical protein n=1 Tax=Streptomyces rishiriensis TaxID=68264 RepID=UPI0037926A4A
MHRARTTLTALAGVAIMAMVTAPGAAAAGVETDLVSLAEWLRSTTDSQGVPLEHYQTLPLDRGDILNPSLASLAAVMSFFWGLHYNLVATLLWLLEYLLSFAWVDLLVAPITPIALQLEQLLGGLNWVAFASTIAGATIGLLFIAGRRSQGWGELVLTVAMVMLATGALMNPVSWITGPDGMLEKSQIFASQAAVDLTGGDSSTVASTGDASAALNDSVVKDMATLLLRNPAQATAFGHTLQGECDQVFTEAMTAADPMDTSSTDVRDAVSDCDEDAKAYVSAVDFFKPAQQLFLGGGVLVVLLLGYALALVFILSVLLALFYGMWQMVAVLIAILPGTSRTSFLRAFFGVLSCMAVIIATTVLTAVFVNLLVSVLSGTSGLGVVLQMTILFLVTVAVIILLFLIRRSTHRRGKAIADWIARMGLSRNKEPKSSSPARFPRSLEKLGRDELNRRLLSSRLNKRQGGAGEDAPAAPESAEGASTSSASPRPSTAGTSHGSTARQALPRPRMALASGPGGSSSVRGRTPRPAPSGGSSAFAAGKAVARRRLGGGASQPASLQGKVLRGVGMGASMLGGPAGLAGGLTADYLAERADQRWRAGRTIQVDSKGQGRVIYNKPEVVEGTIVDRSQGPRRHPSTPSPRTQQMRATLAAARKG